MIRSLLWRLAVPVSGGALGTAVFCNIFSAREMGEQRAAWLLIAGGIAASWLWSVWVRRLSPELTLRAVGVAPLPWLGALGTCMLPGVWPVLGLALFAGWGVFRELELLPEDDTWWRRRKRAATLMLVPVYGFGLWLVWEAYRNQVSAMNHLALHCDDWWGCLDAAQNSWNGDWFRSSITNTSYLGYYFAPLAVLLTVPLVWLFHSPEPFFLFSALLLYSNAILIYWLARVKNLTAGIAGMLALSVLLSSVLAGMAVGQGGGFHPVFLFQPILILFFICREKEHRNWAMVLWAASLFMCESASWTWSGVGVVLWCLGERRRGVLMTLVSLLWVGWVSQSEIAGFQYFNDAIWDGVRWEDRLDWGMLPQRPALALALQMLMPVALLTPLKGKLIVACLPPFLLSLLLQGTGSSAPQFGSYLMLFYVNAVFGCSLVRSSSLRTRWLGFLGWGGVPVGGKCKNTMALLLGSLAAGAAAFVFLAPERLEESGKQSYKDEIEELKKLIPAGAKMNADSILAAPFVLRNHIYPNFGVLYYVSDYVLMDLLEKRPDMERREQFRGFLLSHGYGVVYRVRRDGRLIVLLARKASHPVSDGIVWMERSDFVKLGEGVAQEEGAVAEVRMIRTPGRAIFFLRPKREMERDLEVTTVMTLPDGRKVRRLKLFGNGVTPAYLAGRNAVMTWSEEWPHGEFFAEETRVNVELRLRSKVEFRHLRFPIAEEERANEI